MNNLPVVQLFRLYRIPELLKATVTGWIFVLLFGGIFVTPLIMISMIYIPFIEYFLLLIYVALSLIGSYGLTMFNQVLQTYHMENTLHYDTLKRRMSVAFAIVVFVVLSYVYFRYLK